MKLLAVVMQLLMTTCMTTCARKIQLASGSHGVNVFAWIILNLHLLSMVNLVRTVWDKNSQNILKTVFTPNNSSVETRYKEEVNRILNAVNEKPSVPFIDFECIETCISRLKYNKAAGCDGTMTEHIAFRNKYLYVHLCLAFNAFLRHCFLPSDFCTGLIVPLLKSKRGYASL